MTTPKLGLRFSIGTVPVALAAVLLAALLPAAAPPSSAHAEVRAPVTGQSRTAVSQPSAGVPVQSDWIYAGQNAHNTRDAATEHIIGPANVAGLTPRWVLTTTGNVAATPAVSRGVVYVPDLGGTLWAVSAASGNVLWSAKVGSYVGAPTDVSRTTPAVNGNEIVIGTGAASATPTAPVGAYLLGIKASTGALLWRTKVDTDPYSMITGSPVVDNGVVYAGISSDDELASSAAPTFRGSVVALSAQTGHVLWQTYTAPPGYTGNAVWGSNPVVDHTTGLLYVATGNNYTVPPGVCTTPAGTGCTPPAASDYFDSVLGLNLQTGAVTWALKTLTSDTWTATDPLGPDYDFGSSPNLYTTTINGQQTDLLGIGQKSGIYWALNPATGAVTWKTQVGAGGPEGGIEWGSATDGTRIYAAISDFQHAPYTITSASGQTSTVTGGSWSALDAATGKILWQTADPQSAPDLGFVSTANGVVYAGSDAPAGDTMYALNASTGAIAWGFPSGGGVISGAAIVNGSVYWGSGYYIPPTGVANDQLYAFSLPGGTAGRAQGTAPPAG